MSGRKSSIDRLEPHVKEAVDRAIREGRATIDEVVEVIDQLGGQASRSAVGRYMKNMRTQLSRFREAQEIAQVWAHSLEDDGNGQVARLMTQMLRGIAIAQMDRMGDGGELDNKEVALLARAIKDITTAEKVELDRELRIRREVAKEAAAAVAEAAVGAGLSGETVESIKAKILGVAR